ncbi:hypothetical protein N0V95_003179 [Ascochyta clinopodiicola]|nr:hypothetical protein N0V95_003179 [Ascochyta clinopodiicola]
MRSLLFTALALSQLPLSFGAVPNCPISGAEFPPPRRLTQHPKWQQALANLSTAFDYLDANITGNNLSYSVQVFSTNPGNAILAERHRTAGNLLPDTEGVKVVNANTVYRLGSISKIFTVLAFLAEVGDIHWNQPITNYIPELAQYARLVSSQPFDDDVRRTDWEDITIGALAAQVSGIGRDCKNFVDILDERVIKPLELKNTYFENAPPSVGIIPTTTTDDYWWVNLGGASPGGNMYSSAQDISILGHAILSSRLIKPSLTRRWLNPVTFSSDFAAAIGAPWGVRRIQLDPFLQPYRSLNVFTKAGTFRTYTAFLTLLKEFNLGFTIMMAGRSPINNFMIADMLGASLIPAYDAAARDEADQVYSGVYVGNGTSAMPNSSMIITTNPKKPGLGIVSWISNGTDMVETAIQLQTGSNLKAMRAEARLYYTQLETKAKNGQMRQSWKAVFEDTGVPSAPGPLLFSTGCGAWVGLTGVTYGSLPLDEFVFDFDSNGQVVSVTNLAVRSTLYKLDISQLPALCEDVCPFVVQN